MTKKKKKKPTLERDAVAPFRDKLWNRSKSTRPAWTVPTLSPCSNNPAKKWAVGTWLTIVCIKLKEMKQGGRPTVRITE